MIKTNLNWADIEFLASKIIYSMELAKRTPTVIVGLTRGGLLPATLLSHSLKVPMTSLDVSLRDSSSIFGGPTSTWIPEEIKNGHRILVVDDINDTGATFEWIRQDWLECLDSSIHTPDAVNWPWNHIKFAVLHHNDASSQPSDFVGVRINKDITPMWINYPWETWNNSYGTK